MSGGWHLVEPTGAVVPVKLGAPVADGATATIHRDPTDPGRYLKVYRRGQRTAAVEAKLAAMLAAPPAITTTLVNDRRVVQLAWPQARLEELAEDAAGSGAWLAGYAMPALAEPHHQPLERLLSPKMRGHHRLPHDQRLRLYAAHNLARLLADLHRIGHHVIDLKPLNVRVEVRTGAVALLDCDGFSILGHDGVRHPAREYSEGAIAPEVQGASPATLDEAQDRFALAVILFQLMNDGIHPFQGTPRPGRPVPSTLQQRINARLYPHGVPPSPDLAPSPFSAHETWPPTTQALFQAAFTGFALERPRASAWADHLEWLIARAQTCPRSPQHLILERECGACAAAARAGRRIDPAAAAQRGTAGQGWAGQSDDHGLDPWELGPGAGGAGPSPMPSPPPLGTPLPHGTPAQARDSQDRGHWLLRLETLYLVLMCIALAPLVLFMARLVARPLLVVLAVLGAFLAWALVSYRRSAAARMALLTFSILVGAIVTYTLMTG